MGISRLWTTGTGGTQTFLNSRFMLGHLRKDYALLKAHGIAESFRKECTTFADGTTVTVDWDAGTLVVDWELRT